MDDLRINEISFSLNNQVECEEVFRDLCSHHKVKIAQAKAFSDAQSIIGDNQVYKLCRHLNLRVEIDFLRDKFSIFYPDKENAIVSFPGQKEVTPKKSNDDELDPGGPNPDASSANEDDDDDLF